MPAMRDDRTFSVLYLPGGFVQIAMFSDGKYVEDRVAEYDTFGDISFGEKLPVRVGWSDLSRRFRKCWEKGEKLA